MLRGTILSRIAPRCHPEDALEVPGQVGLVEEPGFQRGVGDGHARRLDPAAVSIRSLLALAYLAVFGSIIGYTAYLWLLKTVEPAKVSTNFYVNPVIAVFVGWLVAGETVTLQMVVAAGVILLDVAVINTRLPESTMRSAQARPLNPPNTWLWITPSLAQASMLMGSSGIMGR